MAVPTVVNDANVNAYGILQAHGHVTATGGASITARVFNYNKNAPSVNAAGVTMTGNTTGAATFTGPPATSDFYYNISDQAVGTVTWGHAYYGHRARATNSSGDGTASDTTDNYWYIGALKNPDAIAIDFHATGYTSMYLQSYSSYSGDWIARTVFGGHWYVIDTSGTDPFTAGTPPAVQSGQNLVTEGVAWADNISGLTAGHTYYVRTLTNNTEPLYGVSGIYGVVLNAYTAPVLGSTTKGAVSWDRIASLSASVSDYYTYADNQAMSAQGFVIATHATPTTSDTTISLDSAAGYGGTMTRSATPITGLSPLTTYYVRAYATNPTNTAYGAETSFTTGRRMEGPRVNRAVPRGSSW